MNRDDGKFGTIETLELIGVSFERLRYWELKGIITPDYIKCGTRKFRRYSRQDIEKARYIKMLVDEEKYSLEGAILKLKSKNNTAE